MNQPSWIKYYMGFFNLRSSTRKFNGEIFYLMDFVEFNNYGERIYHMVFSAPDWDSAINNGRKKLPNGCRKTTMARLSEQLYLMNFRKMGEKKPEKLVAAQKRADEWRKKGYKVRLVKGSDKGPAVREAYFIYVRK